MTLLKRKRVLAAKVETTVGTAIALSGTDGAFNAYDVMIQPNIPFEAREGQGGFGNLSSVPGGYGGTATFKTDIGWDGSGIPSWASVFMPACGFVLSTDTFYPKTEAPGSNVKTLTIGCYIDGLFKSIKGAAGTFRAVFPTGRMAYIEWTFTGIWVDDPSDVTLVTPTYPTADIPLRAAGGATTFNAITLCAENVTFDAGNEVVLRECATSEGGYHAAIITNRIPRITINPEAKLAATRPSYSNWLDRLEAEFSTTIASATGDGSVSISAPKAQIINIQEGDRNRLVTDEIELQCNRNGTTVDQELSIHFSDDT
jgi:hypothetical protein